MAKKQNRQRQKQPKKLNPRRRPVNAADVLRAKEEAKDEATTLAFAIMFTILRDKHNVSNDRLRQFWGEVEELSASIAEGYVSVTDLLHTMQVEAGIFLER